MKFQLSELINTDRDDNFITDHGSTEVLTASDGSELVIPRYAVWVFGVHGKDKHEVAESSDDLEYLMNKYNVPQKKVVKIGK